MGPITNKALRFAAGCILLTTLSHLYVDIKIVPIQNHLNMKGMQFLTNAIENKTLIP